MTKHSGHSTEGDATKRKVRSKLASKSVTGGREHSSRHKHTINSYKTDSIK